MPVRAGRPCSWQGCPEIVRGDQRYCAVHLQQTRKAQDEQRGTAAERGYDARWRRLRRMYLRKHPLCVECRDLGFVTRATDVDHIVPSSAGGGNNESNLQGLCHRHHSAKTLRELKQRGRGS